MTRKLIWLLGTVLVVVAMLLTACSTAATTTQPGQTITATATIPTTSAPPTTTTTTPPTTSVSNAPTYGGSYTFTFGSFNMPGFLDPVLSSSSGNSSDLTYDKLISADWSQGPEGNDAFPFNVSQIPNQYRTGVDLQSFEIKSNSDMIWHVRQGVYFQTKSPADPKEAPASGKQMTSADIIYTFRRGQQDTRSTFYDSYNWNDPTAVAAWRKLAANAGRTNADMDAWIAFLHSINYPYLTGSAYWALDQWTCEYRLFTPYSGLEDSGDWMFIQPTESAGVDLSNFQNDIGTGPYLITDAVQSSSITWRKNPNYWMPDPNHPGNILPYVDTVIGLVIPDISTQVAAIRTHKLDTLTVTWDNAASLQKTNPDMKFAKLLPGSPNEMWMRTDLAPYSDVRVRQALSMGVDRDSIISGYFKGNATAEGWPINPGNGAAYTAIKDMPPDVQQLWQYHPDLSKQLLTAAGFPNGFQAEVDIYVSPTDQDILQLIKEQWANINVNINIKVLDSATFNSVLYAETYPAMIYCLWGNGSPQSAAGWANGGVATSIYAFSKPVDPLAVTAFTQWSAMTDPTQAALFLKNEYLREDKLVWEIPLPTPVSSVAWQPYVKGYSGELSMGLAMGMGESEMIKFQWIDQNLKKQITGAP
jgi:ABC-type transport system substrate-binding protein